MDAVRIQVSVTSIADDAFTGSDITILAPAGSYAIEWAIEKQMEYREE